MGGPRRPRAACLLAIAAAGELASAEFTKGVKYAAFDSYTAVEATRNAVEVLGEVRKDPRPLLVADKPWEMTPAARIDNGYPNIMFDPEYSSNTPWRLWYDCCVAVKNPSKCSPGKDDVGLLYAESPDGLAWTKPSLGLVKFGPSAANNILMLSTHGLGVFKDSNPSEPRSRRYKAMGMTYRPGQARGGAVFTSRDGVRWSQRGAPVDLGGQNRWDTHQNMLWNSRLKQYIGFTRGHTFLPGGGQNRTVARFVSKRWDGPYEAPEVVHAGDGPNDQLYEQLVFPYHNIFLALVVSYDAKREHNTPNDRTRCELAWSPDSIRWHRLRDGRSGIRELIPLGTAAGAADAFDCYPANLPVDVPGEDAIRMYYFGGNGPHLGARNSTMMLARLRRDGFAGVSQRVVREGPAVVRSRPLPCNGERPSVSIDVKAGGSVLVMVFGACRDGSDCDIKAVSSMLTESATDTPVEFQDLDPMPPGECILEFALHKATLYTFGWPNREGPDAAPV